MAAHRHDHPRRETAATLGERRPVRTGLVLTTVAVVQFLVTVDLSIVNIALPQIGDHLGFTPVDLTWVITAYSLAFGGLLLFGGKAPTSTAAGACSCSASACSGRLARGRLRHVPVVVAPRAVQGAGAGHRRPRSRC